MAEQLSPGVAGEAIELNAAEAAKPLAEMLENDTEAVPGAPQVVITTDGEFIQGNWVLLDSTETVNLNNDKLEIQWKQIQGPQLVRNPLALKQTKLWLYLSSPGEFRFIVRARNGQGWSLPAEKKFEVHGGLSALPESDGRRLVGAGELIVFPGEGWRQLCGAKIDLRVAEHQTTFRPVRAGLNVFEIAQAGGTERRGIIVPASADGGVLGDRRPYAKFLMRSPSGYAGKAIILDGSPSHDPDGDKETQGLKAHWVTPDKDRGVELQPMPGLKVRFKASRPGTYCVTLTVSDGRLESEPEKVFVRIDQAPANAAQTEENPWEDAPEFEKDDIRYRKVSLGLWATLDRAIQMFPSRCGVALRVDAEVSPPEKFDQVPLNLEVMDGALMHLINWIARQTDTAYRRQGDASFWLTSPTGWAKEEKLEPITVLIDALYSKPDGSDLLALLKPSFQPIIDAREGASMVFVQNRQEILAVLPTSACARLRELCAVLRAPSIGGLPPPEMPSVPELNLRKMLAEKTISLNATHQRIDFLLRDLAQAAGVAMAMDPRQFPKGLPKVDVNIKNAPLRDAIRTIVDAAGFDGASVEAPAGIWFYKGGAPYPTGELIWDHAIVRAHDITSLLKRIDPLSGEAIAHLIQSRIYPESWKDPGAMCFYHPQTKKLVVIHGAMAQNKVLEFLFDLADRGESALGPVD